MVWLGVVLPRICYDRGLISLTSPSLLLSGIYILGYFLLCCYLSLHYANNYFLVPLPVGGLLFFLPSLSYTVFMCFLLLYSNKSYNVYALLVLWVPFIGWRIMFCITLCYWLAQSFSFWCVLYLHNREGEKGAAENIMSFIITAWHDLPGATMMKTQRGAHTCGEAF